MVIVLFTLAAVAALGAVILFALSLLLLLFGRLNPRPLFESRIERALLAMSAVAAVLGSAMLFIYPAYSGSGSMATVSISGESTVRAMPETRASFYAVNGPKVIPFFTVPVAFIFLPLLAARWRGRALVTSIAAFLLAAMSAFGMSGFGTFFAPSALLVLLSGAMALRGHGARPTAQADTPAFGGPAASTIR